MSNPDPFSKETNNEAPAGNPPVEGASKEAFGEQAGNLLSLIKNDDGSPKYDSVEKALVALSHSQDHIKTVEASSREAADKIKSLEEKVASSQTLDEVVQRLSDARTQNETANNPVGQTVDESTVQQMVDNLFSQREQTTVREQNKQAVLEKLHGAFGDKTAEVVAAKAQEMNMTPEQLGVLSETNPDLINSVFFPGGTGGVSSNPSTSTIRLPMGAPAAEPLQAPEKSLLMGATASEQADFLKKVKEDVYARLGVET